MRIAHKTGTAIVVSSALIALSTITALAAMALTLR